MKNIKFVCLASLLAACGTNGSDNKSNDVALENQNLSAPELTETEVEDEVQPREEVANLSTAAVSIRFQPRFEGIDLSCANLSDSPAQAFRNIRFFVSNLDFQTGSGAKKARLQRVSGATNMQFEDGAANSLALVKLLDGNCEDGEKLSSNSAIELSEVVGNVLSLSFNLGLPYAPMANELSRIPAPMAPSDMGWMWAHYPANFQMDVFDETTGSTKTYNQLISDTPNLVKLDGVEVNDTSVTVYLDLDRLYTGQIGDFTSSLSGACFNQVNTPSIGACLEVASSLGFVGDQNVFRTK